MHLAHTDQRRITARAAGALPPGSILGSVQVPGHVIRLSDQLAGEFYTAAEEIEFCGDQVETFAIPPWASRDGAAWLPDLAALGYRRADSGFRGREELLVATADVDMHTDDEGLVLMVVLHNDGLTFRQGKVRHKPKAGECFIFDDRLPHGVDEAPGRAAFLGWNIPIVPL
ncbi:hypothetical protein KDX16_15785 [Burkholderia vietnamiensis]|jgi:hypothetical protein|uniref:Fe2OG dioxygenase domain-containing protein n=1 Tax=Burkholderia aenigmatica TaxID=2015348 RepID=A0A6P2M3R8_9BURK|nr:MULTISPECIES: hypothetical protein [Burkholderia]HDR9761546.1 hypothetical protein [Burkholderia cepacia ATCC 25416]MBR7917285.1 hypothetical protein [Burkholderia vietnamiensis]MBR8055190.1 hypothetical protein [Burkholderia vietnamiensis]VWB73084.1 hypothetical protein BLA13014_03328 [Burkholderia aenigmatica]HDR9791957.1 hypothetical protein [Burkholderia cepacia ATCC 25416]